MADVSRDAIEHNVESLDCACAPRFFLPCDECEPETPGCWKCIDGLIELDRSAADSAHADGEPLVIVHHEDLPS